MPASLASDDSQKENAPTARVKQERMSAAAAKVKQENAKGKGKKRVEEPEETRQEEAEGSPRGAKRSRVNTNGDSRPSASTNGDEEGQHEDPYKRVIVRDTDGFVPGSIVRVQLKNFVTYDFVEFRPGPYLNMIVGPNGTGKSSIACAIALGLNWPANILGRSKDITGFVKQGETAGHIEIELKGRSGKPNYVIRRNITTRSKASTFTMNGASVTGKEVSQMMEEFNVSVGNLCSFLPQDRVQSFAAMSPQELLKETQKAAGNPNLSRWHETLINAGKEHREMMESIKTEMQQLKQMRERNEGIEREVQRVKERQRIEHEIELLELLIPVQVYRESREGYMKLKKEQRTAHQLVMKLRERNKPAHKLLETFASQAGEQERMQTKLKKTLQTKIDKMKKKWTDSEGVETQMEDLNLKLDSLKKEKDALASKIRKNESDLVKSEEDLQKAIEAQKRMENEDVIREQARKVQQDRAPTLQKQRELEDQVKENVNQKATANQREVDIHNALKSLDNVDAQKLLALRRWNQDTYDALIWIRNNQDKFKMPIMEPPCISVTVTDKRYANAVESCFSAVQLQTFVAQCHEDYNTFNRLLQDEEVLGRKVRLAGWYRNLPIPEPPMSHEELAQQNFDGYILDYISCPEPLRYFLQAELMLHRTAVALQRPQQVNLDEVMKLVTRGNGSANFITGTTMHQVQRSRYGNRTIQNLTRDLRQAKSFAGATVDTQRQNELKAKLKEIQQEKDMIDEQHEELVGQLKEIEAKDKEFEKQLKELKKRSDAIKEVHRRKLTTEGRITRLQKALEELRNQPSFDDEKRGLKKKLLDAGKKRINFAKEYLELSRDVVAAQHAFTKAGLEYLQILANRAALQALCDRKDEKYNQALRDFTAIDEQFKEAKARSTEALNLSRQALSQYKEEDPIVKQYRAIEEARLAWEAKAREAAGKDEPEPAKEGADFRTLDELQNDLEKEKAALEITLAANPGVIEQYEKRKQEIETLEKTIEERQKRADGVEKNIKNARDHWQPALEQLVRSIDENFSTALDNIGCAGEIKIGEHEDYEKWSINIWVKFRDSEKLQPLTSQRQSGGERSLTTMLYLMSLNQECRSPFSLADEINQGMDQFYERTIHNSLVDATCKPDSAQFFLITPKLLAGLRYHEKMKMLCVGNGEWLPETPDLGNMMNMINNWRRCRNGNMGAGAASA